MGPIWHSIEAAVPSTTQNSQNDRIEEVKYGCEYEYDYEYPGNLDQAGGFHNWWDFF